MPGQLEQQRIAQAVVRPLAAIGREGFFDRQRGKQLDQGTRPGEVGIVGRGFQEATGGLAPQVAFELKRQRDVSGSDEVGMLQECLRQRASRAMRRSASSAKRSFQLCLFRCSCPCSLRSSASRADATRGVRSSDFGPRSRA